MLDIFNFPTPQQSNYQEFYGGGTVRNWVKPRGASMVRFMLIGAAGGGNNGSGAVGGGGGGSGAVISWIGPAMFVPDVLRITIANGGTSGVNAGVTTVLYQAKDGTGYTLLSANGGGSGVSDTGGVGGAASSNTPFGASGIFTSTVGQNGANGGTTGGGGVINAALTFLSGGAGGSGSAAAAGYVIPNYGYPTLATVSGNTKGRDGYFITQPILLGCGGAGGGTTTSAGGAGGRGGIGCGGGGSGEDGNAGGRGGDGAVFVWAW